MNNRFSRNLCHRVISAWHDGLRTLEDEAAATSVEYALFVLLLVVSALVGFVTLSALSGFVFHAVSASVEHHSPEIPVTVKVFGQPTVAQRIEAFARDSSVWIEESFSMLDILICFLGGCVGLILTVILVMTFARPGTKRRNLAPEAPSVPPPNLGESHQQALFAKRNLLRRVLRRSLDDRAGVNLPVRYFMSDQLETVEPQTPVHLLGARMRQKGIRHLLVVDKDNALLGVISTQDIHARVGRTAEDIMTTDVITVGPETPVGQAISFLLQKRISRVPVVEDGKVCGILTTTDVLLGFQALLQAWELVFQPLPDDVGDEEGLFPPQNDQTDTPAQGEASRPDLSFVSPWPPNHSYQPPEPASRPV